MNNTIGTGESTASRIAARTAGESCKDIIGEQIDSDGIGDSSIPCTVPPPVLSSQSTPLFTSHKSLINHANYELQYYFTAMTGALVCSRISVNAFLFMEGPMSVAVVIVHGLEHGPTEPP